MGINSQTCSRLDYNTLLLILLRSDPILEDNTLGRGMKKTCSVNVIQKTGLFTGKLYTTEYARVGRASIMRG